ncbi:hypothetical protein ACFWBF_34430 [Streptomyces sp. NPDC060028]|uniref:hypothetical protein n=1 Tax=Streptomyces sp. NPDC060028 TaxID=3347041 RepID=UPI0036A6831F
MAAARRIRFTAVLVGVVLALTGFSSHGGSSGKSKSKSSSGGGGCSSSKSRRTTHTNNTTTNTTTGGSTGTKSKDPARATVVTCAGPGRPQAVIQVTSLVDTERTVDVPLNFAGASGANLDSTSVRVTLKGREAKTVTVPMAHADKAAEIQRCEIGRIS